MNEPTEEKVITMLLPSVLRVLRDIGSDYSELHPDKVTFTVGKESFLIQCKKEKSKNPGFNPKAISPKMS